MSCIAYLIRRLGRERDAVLVERNHTERVRGRRHEVLIRDEVLLNGSALGFRLRLPLVLV